MQSVLKTHEQALQLREWRGELLASNLANAETPHYQARDIDFKQSLASAMGTSSGELQQTNPKHLNGNRGAEYTEIKYRVPMQTSFDGNSVDSQVEQAQFTENSMRYLATLNFIHEHVGNLVHALRGE